MAVRGKQQREVGAEPLTLDRRALNDLRRTVLTVVEVILFAVRAETLELRSDRLWGGEQFTDGLTLNVSNRPCPTDKRPRCFKMTSPSTAALITAGLLT